MDRALVAERDEILEQEAAEALGSADADDSHGARVQERCQILSRALSIAGVHGSGSRLPFPGRRRGLIEDCGDGLSEDLIRVVAQDRHFEAEPTHTAIRVSRSYFQSRRCNGILGDRQRAIGGVGACPRCGRRCNPRETAPAL